MPVIATTADQPCSTMTTCSELRKLNPDVTLVEGREASGRLMAVECNQGQVFTLKWTIRDRLGGVIDLSTCGPGVTAKLRLKEALGSPTSELLADLAATIVDPVNGVVEAPLTAVHTADPGVYAGEWGVFDGTNLIFSNIFFLVVNAGLYGTGTKPGPPRLPEIRLHVRSSCPEDSILLETLEWDMAELAYAVQRPVMYWNETAPPIGLEYNTQSFPYRFHWLEAIVGELMIMAAHSYRRDHLPYTAAGVSVDDKAKWTHYEAEGYRRRQSYERFVLQRKASINMEMGFGSFASEYVF